MNIFHFEILHKIFYARKFIRFQRIFLVSGFWWSFISMTTVGYGDRSPKSRFGKMFAVFWILCGITIMSLLTAAITTAIATVIRTLRSSWQVYNSDSYSKVFVAGIQQ